jgi:transposase
VIADQQSKQILATAFGPGRQHDFALFRASGTRLAPDLENLADSGYQGIRKLHAHSRTPQKRSKHQPLTRTEKATNRALAQARIAAEHILGRLKVFRILAERYRNRRRRFGLRFNLIASLYNHELTLE